MHARMIVSLLFIIADALSVFVTFCVYFFWSLNLRKCMYSSIMLVLQVLLQYIPYTILSVSVQCMKCSARSNTYDPFMDLSLDIRVSVLLIGDFGSLHAFLHHAVISVHH